MLRLVSGGARDGARLTLAFYPMFRRFILPSAFAAAAAVAGLACGDLANRAKSAPSMRAAADQYAAPLAMTSAIFATFLGLAAAAGSDAMRD